MLDFEINGNQAFFIQTSKLYKKLVDIIRNDKQISLLVSKLPPIAIRQFTLRSLIDEIIITNSIEGVHSTRKEIKQTLENIDKNSSRFKGMVKKYQMLMESRDIPMESCSYVPKWH